MNDSNQKSKVTQIEEPTALMGTQVALNIAQGAIDAMNEIGISKSQLKDWDQGEIRKKSKEVTKRFLGFITHDLWLADKVNIATFYLNCFGKEWIPNFSEVNFPKVGGVTIKRPEFIFPRMTEQEALNAYANYFGEDGISHRYNLEEDIDRGSVQKRPTENYIILHVGDMEPDLPGYSYYGGINHGIIFMTPLEGIISAFRYRFETGKMYDTICTTRLAALYKNGKCVCMRRNTFNWFDICDGEPNSEVERRGLRMIVL